MEKIIVICFLAEWADLLDDLERLGERLNTANKWATHPSEINGVLQDIEFTQLKIDDLFGRRRGYWTDLPRNEREALELEATFKDRWI